MRCATARQLSRDQIKTRLSSLDRWALGCIGVVAIGLVAESFDSVVRASWFAVLTNRREIVSTIGTIGELVVTIGVLGEFVIHWLYSRATHRLEEITDAESLEQQSKIAGLNNETERLKADNLALESFLRPRSLPVKLFPINPLYEVTERKKDALYDFQQTCLTIIPISEIEARRFAHNLWQFLREAGWRPRVARDREVESPVEIRDGVHLYTIGDRGKVEAAALSKCLTSFDVLNSISSTRMPHWVKLREQDTLAVLVGLNPVGDRIAYMQWLRSLPEKDRLFFEALDRERRK
jgi:hypothetical protein